LSQILGYSDTSIQFLTTKWTACYTLPRWLSVSIQCNWTYNLGNTLYKHTKFILCYIMISLRGFVTVFQAKYIRNSKQWND